MECAMSRRQQSSVLDVPEAQNKAGRELTVVKTVVGDLGSLCGWVGTEVLRE